MLSSIRIGNPSFGGGFVNVRNISRNITNQNKTININKIDFMVGSSRITYTILSDDLGSASQLYH